MKLRLASFLAFAVGASGSQDVVRRASALYQHTDYVASLRILQGDPAPDAASYLLSGKNYFMSGDYKRAIEFFEKTLALSQGNASASSEAELWLGRAFGRRAESGGWLMAAPNAVRARQCFEKAIALDPANREAKNDLFAFYLDAPGVLGGGIDKAEAAAKSIATERPAEYEFEEGGLAEQRKNYASAEAHLRRAVEYAPTEAGRVLDLARFLARRGRFSESDALFEHARKMAPGQPRIDFAQATADIENHRNLDRARSLLQNYLHAGLTPDDPPRPEALKLLSAANSAANRK
jgi:Flp pilus assembly protein TadD